MTRILGTLQKHSERLNTLVEDLLMLSRLESGAMPMNFQPVQVGELLDAVQDDCRVLLQQSGIDLICCADEDLPVCAMDRFRMEQVFYNLVDNALRHSESREDIEIGAYLTVDKHWHGVLRARPRVGDSQREAGAHLRRGSTAWNGRVPGRRGGTGLGVVHRQAHRP
ncbi:MAG: hypothetical protein HC901_04035, partial [Bdellovibrionaceae bacterium]|nr:hypothetical protein [Pseudobdellovibrionaceae bacterium]